MPTENWPFMVKGIYTLLLEKMAVQGCRSSGHVHNHAMPKVSLAL